jgi:branched-chain amino acid aminotransferase
MDLDPVTPLREIQGMTTKWTQVDASLPAPVAASPLPRFAFFDGRVVPYAEAQVGLLTHALNYGTAVFAGLRGYWSDEEREMFVFRPLDHFRRFLDSARLLRMELDLTPADLVRSLRELLRAESLRTDVYVRPLAFYRDETIGVRLHGLTPAVAIVAFPFGRYVDREEGAHLGVASWRRVGDNTIPARGKIAGAYVNSALAKSDAQLSGFDEALVLTEDGHVCEASAANVFVVRGDAVATPPLAGDILEGVTRRTLMELLRERFQRDVVERPIDRTELYVADEVFLCGTGAQITAVTRIDHRGVGSGLMGPLTRDLRSLFFDVVRGRVERYRHWCEPVYASGG